MAALVGQHHIQLGLGEEVVGLVEALSRTVQAGLTVEIDYSSFFKAATRYKGL